VKTGYLINMTDIAVDQISMRQICFRLRATLGTDLNRYFVILCGGNHRLAFLYSTAGGLFDINVLATFSRMHHLNSVQVVRCTNNNRIDVIAMENISVVAIWFDTLAGCFQSAGKPLFIRIADCCDIYLASVTSGNHISQVVSTHPADSDMGHRQPLVRPRATPGRKHS
jgi:hypothetical protein